MREYKVRQYRTWFSYARALKKNKKNFYMEINVCLKESHYRHHYKFFQNL